MLQNIREKFTGWAAIAILGLIGVTFVFVGGASFNFLGNTYAAKVDGAEINPALFEAAYRDLVQQNPQLLDAGVELRAQVRENVLQNLIRLQALENYLNDNGYRIGDEQIAQTLARIPDFQSDGRFDMELYRTYLLERSLDPVVYEQEQRNTLRQLQVQGAIAAAAVFPPSEYRSYIALANQQRVVTLVNLGEELVSDEIEIDDAAIQAYYDDNPTLYQIPESADVEYIELRRDAVAESIEISEEELRDYYDSASDRYLQDEQRTASHILIDAEDDADEARSLAADLAERARNGESFAELAAEYSIDGLSAANGGSMGTFTESQQDPVLADVIFGMEEGQISEPVRSDFGFHVIRLDAIEPRGPLPFEEVRGELLSELRDTDADDMFTELQGRLNNAIFDLDNMGEVAAAIDAELQTVDGFTRAGGGDLGANQAAIDAVFRDDVLHDGLISPIVELDANRLAVFHVRTYHPPERQPLAEVRDAIEGALRSQRADELLVERAESLLAAINAGEDVAAAAAAAGLPAPTTLILRRNDQQADPAVINDVFAAAKPADDRVVANRVRVSGGGYSVYRLDSVLAGRPESIPVAERDAARDALARQAGISEFAAFVETLTAEADVVINRELVAGNDLIQ